MGQVGPLDLQRGKVWECRRVDRPHTGTIVSKYHQLSVQTETAANCGSISSWVYCLVNECFFSMSQPWMCSPQLSLIVSLCFYRLDLSPMRSPRIHLPSIDISISGYPVCVCVCVGMNCVQSTCALSLLFSLKSCSVAEQKATSWSPPLQVGIAVYFYQRVEVAVIEAAAAPFSPTVFQFAVTSCS